MAKKSEAEASREEAQKTVENEHRDALDRYMSGEVIEVRCTRVRLVTTSPRCSLHKRAQRGVQNARVGAPCAAQVEEEDALEERSQPGVSFAHRTAGVVGAVAGAGVAGLAAAAAGESVRRRIERLCTPRPSRCTFTAYSLPPPHTLCARSGPLLGVPLAIAAGASAAVGAAAGAMAGAAASREWSRGENIHQAMEFDQPDELALAASETKTTAAQPPPQAGGAHAPHAVSADEGSTVFSVGHIPEQPRP